MTYIGIRSVEDYLLEFSEASVDTFSSLFLDQWLLYLALKLRGRLRHSGRLCSRDD